MSCWWLSATPAELRQASTCRVCGNIDADIDLGLCYDCFCEQQKGRELEQEENRHLARLEQEYIEEQVKETVENTDGSGI